MAPGIGPYPLLKRLPPPAALPSCRQSRPGATAHASPTSPCSASASLGWCNLGQTAAQLVMENKSGYIRRSSAHPVPTSAAMGCQAAHWKSALFTKRGCGGALQWMDERWVGEAGEEAPGYLIHGLCTSRIDVSNKMFLFTTSAIGKQRQTAV